MAAAKVLDAFALLAFFEDEPGADLVRSLLLRAEEGGIKLFMSVVNLGEVWSAIARASLPFARLAAGYKAKISDADCFTAALAKSQRTDIVTGDPEFNIDGEGNQLPTDGITRGVASNLTGCYSSSRVVIRRSISALRRGSRATGW